MSFFLFASPLDILAMRSLVRLDVSELTLLVPLRIEFFAGPASLSGSRH
jgi:hypothetical protein